MAYPLKLEVQHNLFGLVESKEFHINDFSFPIQRISTEIDFKLKYLTQDKDDSIDWYLVIYERNRNYQFEYNNKSETIKYFPCFDKKAIKDEAKELRAFQDTNLQEFIVDSFRDWLNCINYRIRSIEKLNLVLNMNNFPIAGLHGDIPNEKFSSIEKEYYRSKFDDIEKLVFDIANITSQEIDELRNEIHELKEQLDFQTKPNYAKYAEGAIKGYLIKKVSEPIFNEFYQILVNQFSDSVRVLKETIGI